MERIENKSNLGKRRLFVIVAILLLSLAIISIIILKPFMTGLVAGEETYTDKISLVAEQHTEFEWLPEETGQIVSLRASGELIGGGSAKIYIEDNGKRYLIYDSEQGKSIQNVLTGLILEPTPDESGSESSDSGEGDSIPSEDSETPSDETLPEQPPADEEIPEEQPQPEEQANETQEPGENATEEINDSIAPENITEELVPEENLSEEGVLFDDICVETCVLDNNFNQTSYRIIIEVDEGAVLKLKTLTYTIKTRLEEINITNMTEMNLTNITEVGYEMIQEDSKIDAVIDSIEYDNETQILNVIFHHESNKRESIAIISESYIDYELDKSESAHNENVTLVVYNWYPSQYFEIKIGQHSQIIGIGDVPEYDFDATVEDANGEAINATVEFVKPVSKETKEEMTGTENAKKIKKGHYNIVVRPEEGNAVQEIEFHDVNINQSTGEFIRIDDVNETEKNLTQYTEVYAIDPTAFNFTNATVTVTAKGSELWKCKDWNFAEQICYGTWQKLMDITPGEDYSFELTPEDPAFGEIYITKAEHLDSSKNFISDIYNETKALDDVWSEAINSGEYVRVTFEKNLTSENDITIYPRIAGGTPAIEVYEKDGAEIIVEFTTINDDEYNKVYLTNLAGEQDSFDLKILGGSVEFDHIIDPALGTPDDGPSIFMSDTFGGGDKGNDGGEFDENPIQLNDYGNVTEKCTAWDCTAWTEGAQDKQGYYCSGGWSCTDWNGVTCSKYRCNGWSYSAVDRTITYCSGAWDCTSWNGNYCSNWGCTSWTTGTADNDYSCSSIWNCTEWNNGLCDKWGCTAWTATSGKLDRYCSGLWDCSSWNGNSCSGWGCSAWTNGATANRDYYPSGGWECSSWNGNYCDNWQGLTWTAAGTSEKDEYCDRWNCSVWDSGKKVCEKWGCLQWVLGATADKDSYCSGIWNCTTWNALSYPAPSISIISPTATTYNNRTQLANISAPGASSIWYNWNGTNYTYTVPLNIIFAEGSNTLTAWANATTGEVNTTAVTFTTDTNPPAAITSLANQSQGTSWIYWNWTNPVSDFSQAIVYLNGTWKTNTSNNYYNATGLAENTAYMLTINTKDTVGNVNTTNVNSTAKTLSSCTENWIAQYGSCLINDTKLKYYTDQNNCGTTINLPPDNGTYIECNYCSHNVMNSSWSSWHNITECLPGNYHTQERNLTQYDSNYSACYLVTGLPSDLWNGGNNNTFYEYQNLTCDYCTPNLVNASWSEWYNATSCRVNDTLTQERNRTQYDSNNCGETENQTFYENKDIMCDYNGAPVITIHSPLDEGTYLSNMIDLNVSANEAVQTWWYMLNGGANATFTANTTVTSIRGSNTLKVYANDSFGNTGYKQVSFTVLGILYPELTSPTGAPTYYEGQDIILQGYIHDEFNNAIENADVTFELINDSYNYDCTNVINLGNGYYNCTLSTYGMQTPHNYNVRVNASKDGYRNGTSTESPAFLLENNQEANLTLQKLTPEIIVLNDTTIVYKISNMLANAKGTSESTNLTDPDAQTWQLGDLGAETVYRNYTLSYDRGKSSKIIILNKSTAEGYDPIYEKGLYAESNQPTIIVPENDAVVQLTLIKNTIYLNQTDTNVTYNVTISILNSGNRDLTDISVVDADIDLAETIDIAESETWNTYGIKTIGKTPQSYTYAFNKTSAYANGTYFYSNQPSVQIPGYGGPYDVVLINIPGFVDPKDAITGTVKVINQNTEVEEDRTLTTWIEDANGVVYDIDARTVYIGKNQSISEQVTLTAPSSKGAYYFVSELTWPTAKANASKSFIVKSSGGAEEGGGGGGVALPDEENTTMPAIENRNLEQPSIPEDITKDLVTLMNTYRELEKKLEESKALGKDVTNSEELLGELKGLIDEIEEKAAKGEYDFARNLIETALNKARIIMAVEGYEISGKAVTAQGSETFKTLSSKEIKQSLRYIGVFALMVLVSIVIVLGIARRRKEQRKMREKTIKKFASSQKKHLEKFEKEIENKLRKADTAEKQEKELETFVKEQGKNVAKFEREINDKLGKIDFK